MGTLERQGLGETILLRSHLLVGRSPACDLRLDDPRVSSEHARLRWTGTVWEVRDLGSRNGTFVGGHRLIPGKKVPLVAGDAIALGASGPPALVLVIADAAPPVASAWDAPSGVTRFSAGGLLVLPDDDHPEVSLIEGRDGRWAIEEEGGPRPVSDRETLSAGGQVWTLDLPNSTSSTLNAAAAAPPTLESIALRFAVSLDEERVDLTVVCPDREIEIPSRSHHYLLVTLARARLAAAQAAPADRGWLDRDELCRMLATDELRLNVDVCRARKQFAALGIQGAANIVDRRTGTGRIRLGVERVDVRRR